MYYVDEKHTLHVRKKIIIFVKCLFFFWLCPKVFHITNGTLKLVQTLRRRTNTAVTNIFVIFRLAALSKLVLRLNFSTLHASHIHYELRIYTLRSRRRKRKTNSSHFHQISVTTFNNI